MIDGGHFIADAPMPDLRTAVMEAKKWLEEKKLESSSKSGVHHETSTLNSIMLPHVSNSFLCFFNAMLQTLLVSGS